jgi:mgtE-like transporter
VKEYGEHSNVLKTILKESIRIIIFASIISSLGGLALENIKSIFISLMPLIILLPTLNDMIGDYGTIVSSTFSTMLHKGEVKKKWWTPEVQEMFMQIIIVAGITAFLSATIALAISKYYGAVIDAVFAFKVFFITIIDVMVLVCLLFITSIYAGLYYFNKKEDPNNFLIPITTSIADFGNMIVLTVLIILFF